jgi:hypothetical protein
MQEPEQNQEAKTIFCQVCRHNAPAHESWCPVLTGVAVPDLSRDLGGTIFQGYPQAMGVNPQDLQPKPSQQEHQPMYPNPRNPAPMYPNSLQQMAGLAAPAQGPPWPRNMLGALSFVQEDGYEVAKIYRESRDRILQELKMQVEVNRQLSRELIDLRLEVDRLKAQL